MKLSHLIGNPVLVSGLGLSAVVSLVASFWMTLQSAILLGWDACALLCLVIALMTACRLTPEGVREQAEAMDEGASTIGMTAQISDTRTRTTKMRRLVMFHSLVSFVFNTAVVATAVNLAAGLAS